VRTALDLERTEGTVITDSVGETPCVFLASLHRAERSIAERLIRLAQWHTALALRQRGAFCAVRSWVDCITNMLGLDLR
jgi:hypothetical protein